MRSHSWKLNIEIKSYKQLYRHYGNMKHFSKRKLIFFEIHITLHFSIYRYSFSKMHTETVLIQSLE